MGVRKVVTKCVFILEGIHREKIGINPSKIITIPHTQITSTSIRNCYTFDLVSRGSPWQGKIESENENLEGNLRGKNIYRNAERQKHLKLKKSWAQKVCNLESHQLDSKLEFKQI